MGEVISSIDAELQLKAMGFLNSNAFDAPDWLNNPDFMNRIQNSDIQDNLMEWQMRLLNESLNPARMKRLETMEVNPSHSKVSKDVLVQLRSGLFKELREDKIHIKSRRQKLQMAYVGLIVNAITKELHYEVPSEAYSGYSYNDYAKSLFFSELVALEKEISMILDKVEDDVARAHLFLCLLKLNRILSPYKEVGLWPTSYSQGNSINSF